MEKTKQNNEDKTMKNYDEKKKNNTPKTKQLGFTPKLQGLGQRCIRVKHRPSHPDMIE